jgi:hypothetical protein
MNFGSKVGILDPIRRPNASIQAGCAKGVGHVEDGKTSDATSHIW